MDKYQNTRAFKIDKQAPGCLGRVVNLFDVSAGVSANKLLTEKPHLEGPPSRNRSEGTRMLNPPSGTKKRNIKMATPDLRNVYYMKPHPTSMELLSSSKEAESKHDPPNVVAQLMGLAALPQQQRMRPTTKNEMDHRKFVEHQSKSEKLCEFKDAVEVLSSNKEFLLKFIPEPNALIPKDKPESLSPSVPPRTKRITVLRPSRMTGRERFPVFTENLTEGSADKNPSCVYHDYLSYDGYEYESQPTQIVVLKPNIHGTKSSVSLPSASTKTFDGCNVLETENAVGDNNSFSKLEHEYAAEDFIDFGMISPTTRHSSRDYRFDSPFSLSSLSRGSYSPEASVCREAKKRLSERWVVMAADGTSREERDTSDRSFYTLGEMFALSESNNLVRRAEDGERFHLNQTGPKVSMVKDSGKKTTSSSFKEKVSNLLFSRNKRSTEKKSQSMEESRPGLLTQSSPDSAMLTAPNQEISILKPVMCRNAPENQDQPSPVSVLEFSYEEDAMQTRESSGKQLLSQDFHSSSLIGKSPLIESVARTMTWDGSCSERDHTSYSEYHLNAEDNEQEQLGFRGAKREWRNSELDSCSMAVESVVRKEVVLGDIWNQELRLEIHRIGEEIEGELVEELVDQTICDLLSCLSF